MWQRFSSFWSRVAKSTTSPVVELTSNRSPAAQGDARQKHVPHIDVKVDLNHYKAFTSPNPDIKASVYSEDGIQVGRVTYAVSPLFDRLYIFDIQVKEPYRRQRFGLAIMDYLGATYGLPIMTIKEVHSASQFWQMARQASRARNYAIGTLSVSEMGAERARWASLKPKVEQLEKLISDRLFNKREPWESAVGRGLPDWPSTAPKARE